MIIAPCSLILTVRGFFAFLTRAILSIKEELT